MDTQKCISCGIEKQLNFFYKDKKRKNGHRPICIECFNIKNLDYYHKGGGKEKQKARAQKHNLKKYGLTVEDYNAMVKQQGGICKICGSSKTHRTGTQYSLFVDHDHLTGKVRGLLCHHCNAGLGHFKDDVETLKKAINYLNENIS